MDTTIKKDAERIAELGGPAAVARLLGFDPACGTQRVHNWTTRGIPVRIKYQHPELFPQTRQERAAA